MQSFLLHPALGRGIIITPSQSVPADLATFPEFEINQATLENPDAVVDQLHTHWVNRQPVVIRLGVDPNVLKQTARAIDNRTPWEVGASFLFAQQRLHFLVWNNNVDLRSGEPVWWWTKKAEQLGAKPTGSEHADVVLPDGSLAVCDGGPLRPFALDDVHVVPYTAIENGSLRVLHDVQAIGQLAADQSTAVNHRGGPARVIAPAGSGKTRVLTERLRHLLADWKVEPGVMCAVAYNTRAAHELTERTAGLPTRIRTLNALALAIVNGTGGFARSVLEPKPRTMLDERDVRNILQSMVELPRKMNSDPLAPWVEALSHSRLGLQNPAKVEDLSGDVTGFADIFERYRSHLADRGLLDFDEQIYRATEILLRDPDARQVAQRQCRMLLVDEFQDLTPAHMLMLRLLASPALDVFGVGDDDQVIYGYAGADPRYLVDFDSWFPGAAHHQLEVNYRCAPEVVTAASNMLTRNGVRVVKTIRAVSDRAPSHDALRVEQITSADMANRALKVVNEWISDGVREQDIAILTRVNVTLLPIQVLLSVSNIAHTSPVSATLLERTGIRTALAYLRIALDPTDIHRSDIIDTIRRPSRKIARNVSDMITKRSRTSLTDLRRLAASLTGTDGPRVDHYVSDLQAVVDAVRTGDTALAFEVIRTKVGLGEAMDVLDSSRKEADRSTHADDLAALAAVAHLHPDVATFETWLRNVLNMRQEGEGIELATVHKVKGREWDRVITYDVSAGLMPHRLATDKPEERRVFHVAITRGRHRVTVLADSESPSPFLDELAAPGEPEVITRALRMVRETPTTKKAPGAPAEIGMALSIPGGMDGTVIDITDSAVIVGLGKARTTIPFGSSVRVNGKLVDLAPPLDESTERRLSALKDWRRSTATELKVPAYTVFHDSHLEGIATLAPTTLQELARCSGIGPAKLERWGDEVLGVLETAQLAEPKTG